MPAAHPLSKVERRYETVTQWSVNERWITALSAAELFAFATQTTNADYMKAQGVGVSFCIVPGIAAYVPLRHDPASAPEQLEAAAVLAALKPLLEDTERGTPERNLKLAWD